MPLASGQAAKAFWGQHRAIIDHGARFAAACAARSRIARFFRRQLRARAKTKLWASCSLDQGADVNQVYDHAYERQLTPLEVASWYGQNISVVRVLLDHGASVHGSLRARVSGWMGRLGNTVLHGVKDPQIAELLIQRGADIRRRDDRLHMTPLGLACSRSRLGMVQLLLRHGERTYTTDDKNDALISACSRRGTDGPTLVCLLLDAGAGIEAITYDGGPTPLCAACKNNVPATVQLLCDRGADVNAQDSKPMWLACRHDRPKIAEILLAHGACVDPPSCFHGNTDSRRLVGVACKNCRGPEVVRLLLDHGAPMERTYEGEGWDKLYLKGHTPLMICVHGFPKEEIASLLLSRGAAFEEALAYVRRGIQSRASGGLAPDQNYRYGPINALFDCFLVPHYLLCARLYVAGHRSNHPTSARHRIFADPFLSRLVVAFLVGPSVSSPGGERAALDEWKAKLASLGQGPPPEDY